MTDDQIPSSLPCIRSQVLNFISSQRSGHSDESAIPLFSTRPALSTTTDFSKKLKPTFGNSRLLPSFSSSQKTINRFAHQKQPINDEVQISENFNRINRDPTFTYRPVSEVPERYRSIFSKYPSFNKVQSKVLDDVLFSDAPIVLSAPTGSGKTGVFELAIVRLLAQHENSSLTQVKIVYMAPLKALCCERLNDWRAKFAAFNLKCIEVTGDTDIDDYSVMKKSNIIFTTPEKWDSVTRKWKEHTSEVRNICLFLIDEVHMVGDSERGSTIEAVISRMKCIKDSTGSQLRFVAVSATIPNAEDFAAWFSTAKSRSICHNLDESYRPVPLQKVVLSYPDCAPNTAYKFDLNLNYKLPGIIEQHSPRSPTIVFCSTRKGTMQAATALQQQKRFIFGESERAFVRERVSGVVDSKLRELMSCGIAYHHAGLTQSDRQTVESLFLSGHLPVICATSTLAMGVNLPAHLVIVKSTLQYAAGKFREYSPADVLQMIGRAGRPQFDETAVAVIMTQHRTKQLYSSLISGSQVVESSFHRNLTDHLNSEIVLKTLTHVSSATHWMTSLFLFVRIGKNPVRYGLPADVTLDQIKRFLEESVMAGIRSLRELSLITLSPDGAITPTDAGSLMARYCIAFRTMKMFCELKGDEGMREVLEVVAGAAEFSDVQLRVQEKSTLNLLNKNKSTPVVRYPYKERIKTNTMKISVLLQAVLGCLSINDFSLNQESLRIVQVAARLAKCLFELQSQSSSFQSYVTCLLLMKCFNCRLWENTKFLVRQFKNVGPMLGGLLANAGIVSLPKLLSVDPRELEMICNKNPPFGTNLLSEATAIPQYELFVKQVGSVEIGKATLQVFIKPKIPPTGASQIRPGSTTSLVIGTPENTLVYKRRLKDRLLAEDQSFQCELNVYRAVQEQAVVFWLVSHTYVGGDIKSTFHPKFLPDISFPEKVTKPTAPVEKGKTGPYNRNPYIMKNLNHGQKMDMKLDESSRILAGKARVGKISNTLQKIIKPDDDDDDFEDFDDIPEWKIKEILEPVPKRTAPQSGMLPMNPSLVEPTQVASGSWDYPKQSTTAQPFAQGQPMQPPLQSNSDKLYPPPLKPYPPQNRPYPPPILPYPPSNLSKPVPPTQSNQALPLPASCAGTEQYPPYPPHQGTANRSYPPQTANLQNPALRGPPLPPHLSGTVKSYPPSSLASVPVQNLPPNLDRPRQVVKPILKNRQNAQPPAKVPSPRKESALEDDLERVLREMEDSGYFDDFEGGESSKNFDLGVGDLLPASQEKQDAPPPGVSFSYCSGLPTDGYLSNNLYQPPQQNQHSHQLIGAYNGQPIQQNLGSQPPGGYGAPTQPPRPNLSTQAPTAQYQVSSAAVPAVPQQPAPQDQTFSRVIRLDENGVQFRECGHKCADKTTCSHFCCRYGVRVKETKKRGAKSVSFAPKSTPPRQLAGPVYDSNFNKRTKFFKADGKENQPPSGRSLKDIYPVQTSNAPSFSSMNGLYAAKTNQVIQPSLKERFLDSVRRSPPQEREFEATQAPAFSGGTDIPPKRVSSFSAIVDGIF